MKIPRNVINTLKNWKAKPNRLPLLVRGVRQVGKTAAITSFGKEFFPDFLRVDLEKDTKAANIFRESKDPNEILLNLQIVTGQKLSKEGLLFIDEIHACPPALTALKYFAEDMPDRAVIVAGSLLGILLAGVLADEPYSFPVGKVEFMELQPITFEEFLRFRGAEEALSSIATQVDRRDFPIAASLHSLLWDKWKEYLVVGGLPQVITEFASAAQNNILEGFAAARNKQEELVTAYEADIAKHSGKVNAQHIIRVLRAIPSKLAAAPHEGTQRFTFKDVVPGIRGYDRLAGAIDWLTSSGLAVRLPAIKKPLSPLKGFADEHLFKLFLFDVGIMGALAGVDPGTLYQFSFGMFKGYFAESFVLQELIAGSHKTPIVTWSTNQAEVEFVIENSAGIIPIEVKSSSKFKTRSLASFEKRYQPARSFVLSASLGSLKGRRIEMPLYLARMTNLAI